MKKDLIGFPVKLKCTECNKSDKYLSEEVINLSTEKLINLGPLHIGDILNKVLIEDDPCDCNHGTESQLNSSDGKIIILAFPHPISININEEVKFLEVP